MRPIDILLSESEVVKPLRPIDILQPWIKADKLDISTAEYDPNDPEFIDQRSNRENLLEKYKQSTFLANKFWDEFRDDYLLALRDKHRGCINNQTANFPKEGDVFLIADANTPRSRWKLGRIQKLISPRTALVKVGEKNFERATKHLFPLELDFERSKDNAHEED